MNVKKDLSDIQGFKDRLEGGTISGSGYKGGRLERIYVNEVNEVLCMHENSNKGDAPIAGETYTFQIDIKRQGLCQKTLNYLNKIPYRQLCVHEAVRYAIYIYIQMAKG